MVNAQKVDRVLRASKGTVGVEAFQGRLRLRLPRQLYAGKQKYLTLGLDATEENYRLASAKAKQIEADIVFEKFDHTLVKYKPQILTLSREPLEEKLPILSELWDRYTQFKSSQLEESTIQRDYGKIQKRILKLPTQDPSKAVEVRDYLLRNYSVETAKRTLKELNACCKWAVRSKLLKFNPFEGMVGEIRSKKARATSRMPFTQEEMKAIIQAFEDDTYSPKYSPVKHSYYAPYVKFLFLTGARPEEAIALKWKHIDRNNIIFCEAVATDVKIRKDTKTHTSRTFQINDQLRALLNSIKPNQFNPNTLVFSARNGKEIDAHNFLNRVWKKVVENLVEEGKVKQYLPQYNARHTFITLCLEANISVVQVAKWVGNSPEIIMKHYAGIIKQSEVPEF